jgi:integrase/recombinase XerD
MKLAEASKGFLLMKATEYSPNTLKIYEWALSNLCAFLNDPEVKKITDLDLQRFLLFLQNDYQPNRKNGESGPLKPRSIENAWTAIRSFFNWATEEFTLKKRPDRNIKRPRYQPAVIVPFSEEEIRSLLKACERTTPAKPSNRNTFTMRRRTASRDTAILLVLLDSGLRVSECARLKVKNVNMETGEVFVAPFGTGQKTKSRVVILGKAAKRAVWRYLSSREDSRQDDPLFLTERGASMDRNSIRLLLSDLGRKTGIADVHPHRFRHTMAIFFLRNGGDVFSLKRLLGHSSLTMVEHYLQLAQTDVAQAHRNASPADRMRL